MRKKEWLMLFSGLVILPSLFFLFLSASAPARPAPAPAVPTCCKKTGECTRKAKGAAPGEMIMENISRQFISIPALNN